MCGACFDLTVEILQDSGSFRQLSDSVTWYRSGPVFETYSNVALDQAFCLLCCGVFGLRREGASNVAALSPTGHRSVRLQYFIKRAVPMMSGTRLQLSLCRSWKSFIRYLITIFPQNFKFPRCLKLTEGPMGQNLTHPMIILGTVNFQLIVYSCPRQTDAWKHTHTICLYSACATPIVCASAELSLRALLRQ